MLSSELRIGDLVIINNVITKINRDNLIEKWGGN